jgi:hypothetical protein
MLNTAVLLRTDPIPLNKEIRKMPPTARKCVALSLCSLLILVASLVTVYFTLAPSLHSEAPPPPDNNANVQLRPRFRH